MPRAGHKATPRVIDGWLYWEQDAIKLETPAWLAWLATHDTFYYVAPLSAGRFTAHRDQRAQGLFWYAYRRRMRTLHKVYLGNAEELTVAHLQTVAEDIAARAV